MKANKVPEKLYCCDKGNGNIFVDYRPFPNDDNIEYTRTNAFIEKACAFLQDRIEHDSIDYPMATHWLIEDFKKYMEE